MSAATVLPDGSRRRFVAGGGALIVSVALAPALRAADDAQNVGKAASAAPSLPGGLEKDPLLDSWIRVDADGSVTVFTGKAELGQGIKTALIQLAADELFIEPRKIALVTADTARTPNEGYTAGSHSMQDSGTAIRHAAAQVRAILIGQAAARLAVPALQLTAANGAITASDGRSITYGELVRDQLLHVRAQPQSPLKDAAAHALIGKPFPRVDIPAKVSGRQSYVQDLRLPGMVHGRIVPPPSPGARLVDVQRATIESLPGVLKVVRDGRFLAVIAEREWQAIAAMHALSRAAAWEEKETLPGAIGIAATMQKLPAQDTVIAGAELAATTPGSAATSPSANAGATIRASYRRPYQAHGSIGPSCAVGLFKDDAMTVWTHSQGVYPLRGALAELLALPAARVRCVHVEGSGCYGHNGADDVAADAALLARAFPGRPVRVQWMREHEHAWEPFGPAMATQAAATLDASGAIASWQYDVWSNTHSTRPGRAGDLLSATFLAQPFAPTPPKPLPQPEGGGDRNAIPLYRLPGARVVHHFIPQMPLRVSALRSLGAYMNIFSIESFIDELARAAKADPVDFRLRHLDDVRARDVIRTAAGHFGWAGYRREKTRGRGFAFARYKNLGAYAAVAMDVDVQRDTGRVRVLRAIAATDSGEAVNPDGIRNQIEGGIIQSLSWTLYEAVDFDRTRVLSRDWSAYPILRFASVPDAVEVHVIDRPGQPFLGTGEAAQGPAAAALANAIADATGVRLRDLPLSPRRVRDALLAS